ncbi:hypothetical protein D3C84_1193040 [compost metagenome]
MAGGYCRDPGVVADHDGIALRRRVHHDTQVNAVAREPVLHFFISPLERNDFDPGMEPRKGLDQWGEQGGED